MCLSGQPSYGAPQQVQNYNAYAGQPYQPGQAQPTQTMGDGSTWTPPGYSMTPGASSTGWGDQIAQANGLNGQMPNNPMTQYGRWQTPAASDPFAGGNPSAQGGMLGASANPNAPGGTQTNGGMTPAAGTPPAAQGNPNTFGSPGRGTPQSGMPGMMSGFTFQNPTTAQQYTFNKMVNAGMGPQALNYLENQGSNGGQSNSQLVAALTAQGKFNPQDYGNLINQYSAGGLNQGNYTAAQMAQIGGQAASAGRVNPATGQVISGRGNAQIFDPTTGGMIANPAYDPQIAAMRQAAMAGAGRPMQNAQSMFS